MNSQLCWHPLDIRQFYIMQHRIEGEQVTYEDEPSNNTSLTINKLENAFEQNQNQIQMMEKFIKSKTSEIATLQEYLIGEFQNIENAKARNKRIEKILVTQAIPALKDISTSLRKFKDYLSPFASVATAYITTLASKSREMLAEKQATIDQQARTIQQLHQKLDSLGKNSKQEQWQKPKGHNESKYQEVSLSGKTNYCIKNESYLIDHKVHKVQKEVSPARQSLTKITYQKERPKEMSKSPLKVTKYEQCYQNIIENKKFINYRCQRPLSPLQMNGDLHRKHDKNKQDFALGHERKQCIKQKIEKIKIRNECKQKQTKFAFYDNNH